MRSLHIIQSTYFLIYIDFDLVINVDENYEPKEICAAERFSYSSFKQKKPADRVSTGFFKLPELGSNQQPRG